MSEKPLQVCETCTHDLESGGYAVMRFPAMLPTIGRCSICKQRKPIFTAAVGKLAIDKPCGEMIQSPAVTVLQHGNTR